MARWLTYDGEKFDLELDIKEFDIDEAIECERLTAWGFLEFLTNYETGNALAQKVVAFVIVKRARPDLRFTDFHYKFGEVERDLEPEDVEPDPTPAGDDLAQSD